MNDGVELKFGANPHPKGSYWKYLWLRLKVFLGLWPSKDSYEWVEIEMKRGGDLFEQVRRKHAAAMNIRDIDG